MNTLYSAIKAKNQEASAERGEEGDDNNNESSTPEKEAAAAKAAIPCPIDIKVESISGASSLQTTPLKQSNACSPNEPESESAAAVAVAGANQQKESVSSHTANGHGCKAGASAETKSASTDKGAIVSTAADRKASTVDNCDTAAASVATTEAEQSTPVTTAENSREPSPGLQSIASSSTTGKTSSSFKKGRSIKRLLKRVEQLGVHHHHHHHNHHQHNHNHQQHNSSSSSFTANRETAIAMDATSSSANDNASSGGAANNAATSSASNNSGGHLSANDVRLVRNMLHGSAQGGIGQGGSDNGDGGGGEWFPEIPFQNVSVTLCAANSEYDSSLAAFCFARMTFMFLTCAHFTSLFTICTFQFDR